MTTVLEQKMDRLQKQLKARTKPDGTPRRNYAENVAQIRAEMEIISRRIEVAQSLESTDGE